MFSRLERELPWKAQVGCSAGIALVVATPGLFIGYMAYVHDHSDDRVFVLGFAGVFVAVGLLLLLSGVHQAFAVRSPETIVELEPAELTPGGTVRIRITQPGPLRLKSIHANLAGEQTSFGYTASFLGQGGKRTRRTKFLGPHRMLEIGRQDIASGETLEREATFVVPDIPVSQEVPGLHVRWKIEVWGRVAMWPDFMHPFIVKVVAAPGSTPASQ